MFPTVDSNSLYKYIESSSEDIYSHFKRLEICLKNKNYTRSFKTSKLNEFVQKNKSLDQLSKFFHSTKNLKVITLAIIVALRKEAKIKQRGHINA